MTILAFIRTIMVGTGWAVWITFAAFALFLFALAWADRRMRLRLEADMPRITDNMFAAAILLYMELIVICMAVPE